MQQRKLNNVHLSPIKKSKKLKQKLRQNNFVLDCTNIHAKMQTYNSMSDKFLAYYVIRLPRKKKQLKPKNMHTTKQVNSSQFKKFLQTKKQQILKDKTNEAQKIKIQQNTQDQKEKYYTHIEKQGHNQSKAHTKRQSSQNLQDHKVHQKVKQFFQQQKCQERTSNKKRSTKKAGRKSMQNLTSENKQNFQGEIQQRVNTNRLE